MKAGLNGVAQWSLNRGCVLMYEGSIVVLLGTQVTSTVDLARIMRIYAMELGRKNNGGGRE
jgi:hypothetical protein